MKRKGTIIIGVLLILGCALNLWGVIGNIFFHRDYNLLTQGAAAVVTTSLCMNYFRNKALAQIVQLALLAVFIIGMILRLQMRHGAISTEEQTAGILCLLILIVAEVISCIRIRSARTGRNV